MNKKDLCSLAKETERITEDGFYFIGKERIEARPFFTNGSIEDVTVLSPTKLESIEEDEDEFFERSFYGYEHCDIFLLDCDSFVVAKEMERPLVMNFANALHPGGGFLQGAHGQEESLCVNSTLYGSLSTAKAYEMYDYNFRNKNAFDSDYMLLSPNVVVFRDENHELLEEPYVVSVMTVPAPNKRGRAAKEGQVSIDIVMKDRLRKFLMAAARYGYSELVLGAWGCGAFGHDTKQVAKYFYELLIEDKFYEFFKTIAFAIIDNDKCDQFKEVFGDEIDDCRYTNTVERPYFQASYPFPICNYTSDLGQENIGYAQGVLRDGVPFVAEKWTYDTTTIVAYMLPILDEFYRTEDTAKYQSTKDGGVVGFQNEVRYLDEGVLNIGMAILDESGLAIDLVKTVDYLKKNGLVEFPGSMENGSVLLYTDIQGQDVLRFNITMEENGVVSAKTDLKFKNFPNRFCLMKR